MESFNSRHLNCSWNPDKYFLLNYWPYLLFMQHIDTMDWKEIYHLLIACLWKSIIIKNGSVSWPVSTCSDYNFFFLSLVINLPPSICKQFYLKFTPMKNSTWNQLSWKRLLVCLFFNSAKYITACVQFTNSTYHILDI